MGVASGVITGVALGVPGVELIAGAGVGVSAKLGAMPVATNAIASAAARQSCFTRVSSYEDVADNVNWSQAFAL